MYLYYFFKRSACRRPDLFQIEESLGLEELAVLCHVQSWWSSLVPALQHLLTVKDALKKLLLVEMPKNVKTIIKNDKYIVIKKALESKEVEVEMEFILNIKPIFDGFLTKFQKGEPMIHLLHSNCEKLLKTAMGRLMQGKAYIDIRWYTLKEINCESVELQLKNDQFKGYART